MNIFGFLDKIWKDIFIDNVVYLSSYKFERSRKYPRVGFKFFKDFLLHKKWMLEESKRLRREEHNKKVSEAYKSKPLNTDGSSK